MGQTPSVRPEESKVTGPELSMPEITSGNSQGVPVDNNPSVFTAARTKSKIRKSHVTIGIIATVVVLLAILIGLLFSEISSLNFEISRLKDKLSENKAKDMKTNATIAALEAKTNATIAALEAKTNATIAALETDLKAKDNANKAIIASLESQMKSEDNDIMDIINKVKHVEVGRHHLCEGSDWFCDIETCAISNTINFTQSYDTVPLIAVTLDSMHDYDFKNKNHFGFQVTSVEKSGFTVRCKKNVVKPYKNNTKKYLFFTWISLPNI